MSRISGKSSGQLRYSVQHFDQYFKQLKVQCKKSKGGHILSRLITDPITSFLDDQLIKIEEATAGLSSDEGAADEVAIESKTEEPIKAKTQAELTIQCIDNDNFT